MPLLSGNNATTSPNTIAERAQQSTTSIVDNLHHHNKEHHDQDNQLPHPPLHQVDLNESRVKHEKGHCQTADHHQERSAYPGTQLRKGSQTQHSDLAKAAVLSSMSVHTDSNNNIMPAVVAPAPHPIANLEGTMDEQLKVVGKAPPGLAAPERPSSLRHRHTDDRVGFAGDVKDGPKPKPMTTGSMNGNGNVVGSPTAMNDTPATTAPSSPSMLPKGQNPNESKVRVKHPTTLDIPGLTKSAVSPDGRIAQRDLGSKLVIVMVGLPARGKSYITKKLARYLNWLQHDTRIFNVGDRRRVVASGNRPSHTSHGRGSSAGSAMEAFRQQLTEHHTNGSKPMGLHEVAAHILLNGGSAVENSPEEVKKDGNAVPSIPELVLPEASQTEAEDQAEQESFDQSASFFDPDNKKAADLREQVALESLDDLLDYIMYENGSIGILDATNSTLERRAAVMKKVRDRAGPDLNVLFIESICVDANLLERNIRLKLSGPDYRDKDPEASLADFRSRIAIYEKNYVALGEYEEKNNMPYVQMIDVGRKIITHRIDGFLSAQAVYYLLNFNLTPRQIWITRHGESQDNQTGRLGGDSELTTQGHEYAQALAKFLGKQRREWEIHELDRHRQSHFPPTAGDLTPPNPHCEDEDDIREKSFCVWTSMLKRSIQTAEYFDESDFDVKQMRMLNEIYAGKYEGFTYEEIKQKDRDTFEERKKDKLHYRYPGPGGEGYLDVINRLRPVILELERMHDHCILIGHRSVARILLAYFKGLPRDEVTDLDVPIGMLYCLEPRPFGVDFKAYLYSHETKDFEQVPEHQLLNRANSYVEVD